MIWYRSAYISLYSGSDTACRPPKQAAAQQQQLKNECKAKRLKQKTRETELREETKTSWTVATCRNNADTHTKRQRRTVKENKSMHVWQHHISRSSSRCRSERCSDPSKAAVGKPLEASSAAAGATLPTAAAATVAAAAIAAHLVEQEVREELEVRDGVELLGLEANFLANNAEVVYCQLVQQRVQRTPFSFSRVYFPAHAESRGRRQTAYRRLLRLRAKANGDSANS